MDITFAGLPLLFGLAFGDFKTTEPDEIKHSLPTIIFFEAK